MAINTDRSKICPLRSSTSSSEPQASDLLEGEIFINMADCSLGFKSSDGTIKYIVGKAGSANNDVVHISGSETITGQKTFTQTIVGTCQKALWADLAEYYEADKQYEPGTLLQFGGSKEVTIAKDSVNGVVSTCPGFVLNANLKDGIPVALCGRIPIRIIGRVNRFDKIVLSSIPGVGCADNTANANQVIGRALRSKHTQGEGRVLCAAYFKLAID